MGRNDGARGMTNDQIRKYTPDCGSKIKPEWEAMYVNGRNAGLVEFCSPDNAYELGKMGIPYLYVCPATMEGDFLAGYRRGEHTRDLEMETRRAEGLKPETPDYSERQ